MPSLGDDLIQAMREALAHARGELELRETVVTCVTTTRGFWKSWRREFGRVRYRPAAWRTFTPVRGPRADAFRRVR